MKDLVSIITPSYKSEEFISETIDSVLKQTYNNWEMLIVDDLSPCKANKIIEKYCDLDKRIKLIKLNQNSGPAVARNVAIENAKGRFISFLDADDIWEPKKLERQIDFMLEKKCALSHTSYRLMRENGSLTGKVKYAPLKISYNGLLKSNQIGCLTAIYDTKELGKVYMPLIKKRQDYGLWLEILKKTDFAFGLNEPLANYRLMSESVSSNKINLIKYNYNLLKNIEGLSFFKSIYYLSWNILIKVLKK